MNDGGPALVQLVAEFGEAFGEPLLLLRTDGTVVASSSQFDQLAGCSPSGRCFTELVADAPDESLAFLRKAARTRTPIPGSVTLRTAQGEVRVRARGGLVRPGGEAGMSLVLLRLTPPSESQVFKHLNDSIQLLRREVSEWREKNSEREALISELEEAHRELGQLNDELQYRSRLLSAVTENAATALVFLDECGCPTYLNRAALDLFECREDELLGKPLHDTVHYRRPDGRSHPREECPIATALSRGVTIGPYEDMFIARSGRPVPTRVVASPLEHGFTRGTVVEIQDIRDQKAQQARVEELTRELLRTVEHLQSANAAKDEFLGLVSHELRTPITVITGNSRSLLTHYDKLDHETRRGAVADIVSEADRLHRLIENMLVLSRIERGRQIECEPVLLHRLVPTMVQEAGRIMPDREISLTAPAALPPAFAAPQSVEQMLLNLLSNADKYSPAGAPIDVHLSRGDLHLEIRVLDRGPGIAEDEAKQLFSAFFRSPATARTVQGAGLGLAVCQRLAEAQGGRAWYAPRPGGGAEFGFSLPVLCEGIE